MPHPLASLDQYTRCMIGTTLVIPAQIFGESLCQQPKYPGILSQNGKMTFEVTINGPYFQYQL